MNSPSTRLCRAAVIAAALSVMAPLAAGAQDYMANMPANVHAPMPAGPYRMEERQAVQHLRLMLMSPGLSDSQRMEIRHDINDILGR
jgi:hypothetical protein